MNPKRKAAAALTSASASASVPASVTVPVPASTPVTDPVSASDPDLDPASVPAPAPAPATSIFEAPATETQASSTEQPQATAISPEAPPHSDKKEDISEQVGLTSEQGATQDPPTDHVGPSGTITADARSLSPGPPPSVETTGTTPTEPAATLADSSEVTMDSEAEPDTEDLSDSTKKRVGPEQDRDGTRGGGAKRRLTNPKPGRRRAG